MILTICLLTLLASGGFCCSPGLGGTYTKRGILVPDCCPENQSPSGGPTNNPSATVCYFRRGSQQVECNWSARSQSCNAVATSQTNDTVANGPTPIGEYLIGRLRNKDGVDWFNLYPKKEENSGYYRYNQKTRTGRSAMGLHPGRVSEGCVTIDASDECTTPSYSCYNTHSCWKKIKSLLNKGSMTYKGEEYSGILYVMPPRDYKG